MIAGERFTLQLEHSPENALRCVASAARDWGGEFDPATRRLVLPVLAGIRHGRIEGRVEATRHGSGARLELLVERADYWLHRQSIWVLVLGALGGLTLVVLPLVPSLVSFLPLSILLLLLAWFLVAARVRHQHAREFLNEAAARSPGGSDAEAGAESGPRRNDGRLRWR